MKAGLGASYWTRCPFNQVLNLSEDFGRGQDLAMIGFADMGEESR